MKNNFRVSALIMNMSVAVVMFSMVFSSCKKEHEDDTTVTSGVNIVSPTPDNGGILPESVLPAALADSIAPWMGIYSGETPPAVSGQFVSSPHALLHSTVETDTVSVFNDRYIAFELNGKYVNFYGKQWDNADQQYYEEAYRNLWLVGEGENFTCYYIIEGYPNGFYAKQSTIFSGNWVEGAGGLGNFKVAVLLLETSGNPNLEPKNSFRVLGDLDGLAEDTAWIEGKRTLGDGIIVSGEDAFRMFRK